MSQPRKVQQINGTDKKTVKQVLLEIIANRTGAVSSDEVYGALVNGWELPPTLKQDPRKWVAVMLTEMSKIEYIKRAGTHHRPIICENGVAGAVNLAMYDIAPAGAAFLAAGGGVVPKYKPEPPPLIDEDGTFIPRDGLSAHINGWAVPRCKWRKDRPAAEHIYARMAA